MFIHYSDRLFRTMADIIVAEGYAEVGYEYINIDDCWMEKDRSVSGQLIPDKQRFPYGMKNLANYVGFHILLTTFYHKDYRLIVMYFCYVDSFERS